LHQNIKIMATVEKEFDLGKYRGVNSTVYTGRPQGEAARRDLKLESYDSNDSKVAFLIPSDTTTITPSFFLGLLYESIKKLGLDGYSKKYVFKFQETNEDIVRILKRDIEDGERNAVNSIGGKRGLGSFLNRK
jgi:hypothetical protein